MRNHTQISEPPQYYDKEGDDIVSKREWLLCPVCGCKTRDRIRADTELKNFPLFCPKCKHETLINVSKLNITLITEPAAIGAEP